MLRFITHHSIRKDLRGEWTSDGASCRLRCLFPSQVLADFFREIKVHSLYNSIDKQLAENINFDDIVIVSKLIRKDQVELIRDIKQKGVRLIIDFCDNYFDAGEHQAITLELLSLADVVTANTPEMTKVIKRQKTVVAERIIYVPDAVDVPAISPRVRQSGAIRLLSYGNRLVCNHLNRWVPSLFELSRTVDLSLEVVTSLDKETLSWVIKTNEKLDEKFQISLTTWNEFSLEEAFKRCDIVLIPSDPTDGFNYTKSINRLVECINRGKPVVAFPLPAYMSFSDVVSLTDDVTDGISNLSKMKYEEKFSRLKVAQARVRMLFSDQSLSLAWMYAIKTLIGLDGGCSGCHASIYKDLNIFKMRLEMVDRMLNFHGGIRELVVHLFSDGIGSKNMYSKCPSASIHGFVSCTQGLLSAELIDYQEACKIEKLVVERDWQNVPHSYNINTWRLPFIYEYLRMNFSGQDAIVDTLMRLIILWDNERKIIDNQSKNFLL